MMMQRMKPRLRTHHADPHHPCEIASLDNLIWTKNSGGARPIGVFHSWANQEICRGLACFGVQFQFPGSNHGCQWISTSLLSTSTACRLGNVPPGPSTPLTLTQRLSQIKELASFFHSRRSPLPVDSHHSHLTDGAIE